jgi:hypothetical protein
MAIDSLRALAGAAEADFPVAAERTTAAAAHGYGGEQVPAWFVTAIDG